MRILVYGIHFSPEPIGIGKYTGEMAAWLAARGHDVHVLAAPPYYPAWRVMEGYSAGRYRREKERNVKIWRCPVWIPRHPTGSTRILHYLSVALSSAPIVFGQILWRPDIVLVIAPPLFCAPAAWLAARLSGALSWLHIQDFEVSAAFETGALRQPALRRLALWVERKLIRRFDRVSTVSRNMIARLHDIGVPNKHCALFPNGVDVEAIRPLQGRNQLRDELAIPDGDTVALYAGNMGEKQGLETLLEAARLLASSASVRFVLSGEGASRKRLAQEFGGLRNVTWLPLQPAERLNELLNLADIHVLPQLAGVADLLMPSKLGGMMASGRPVIATAAQGTQVAELVAGRGVVVPPGNPNALASAILDLARNPAEKERLGRAARDYAVEHLNLPDVLLQFERDLLSYREAKT